MIKSSQIFFLFMLLCFKCSTESNIITIGTFNIAWLGDGVDDKFARSKNNYKSIAELIINTNCDIISLQEIENEQALKRLLKYLKEYNFIFGKITDKQNIAVFYKKAIQVKKLGDYIPLSLNNPELRPGLLFEVKLKNTKLIIMAVHLKSTSRYDSTSQLKLASREFRYLQSEKLSKWFDSTYHHNKNIIIIGDFNDNPEKSNTQLIPLTINNKINFLTTHLQSCKFTFLKIIDHIAVSKELFQKYLNNSARVYNFNYSQKENESQKISDHCPVLVNFKF